MFLSVSGVDEPTGLILPNHRVSFFHFSVVFRDRASPCLRRLGVYMNNILATMVNSTDRPSIPSFLSFFFSEILAVICFGLLLVGYPVPFIHFGFVLAHAGFCRVVLIDRINAFLSFRWLGSLELDARRLCGKLQFLSVQ